MPYEIKRIVKSYIILCEGLDTLNFMVQYLNSKELSKDNRFGNCIQVLNFGGISDLSMYLNNLRNMEGYENVTHILVLRDAETETDRAVRMIRKALNDNSLPIPDECNKWCGEDNDEIKVAFTLLPSCSNKPVEGALEDLCWLILKDENAQEMRHDVQDFVVSIRDKYKSIKSHEHKSRLHTYFSVNENYISLKIGEAATAGAFDWGSENLLPLKELIEAGFNGNVN